MTDESMDLTFDDFDVKEEVSVENTETIETKSEEIQETVKAESETEAKAESNPEEGELKTEAETGDNSGAESPATEYTPNFKYNIKDEEHEFPEFLREVVKTKEREDEVRDFLTKANALDGIKEARTKVETDYNSYKQSVENDIYPVLDTIKDFDRANDMKDFGKAWELSDVNPTDVIDYLMMDEKLSEVVYQKVLDQVNAEPQALQAQRATYQEQQNARALEQQNKHLEAKLNSLEQNTYGQALEFALSQNNELSSKFDSVNGNGAFRGFVNEYSSMKRQQGINLQPHEAVAEASKMLGLASANTPVEGNIVNNNEQIKVEPKAPETPKSLPNLGTGSNVSMVQKPTSNWDDWEKQLHNS